MTGFKKPRLLQGPKLNLAGLTSNQTGLAGGLKGLPKAPVMIRTYADYKNLHFAPMPGTKLKLG